MKTHILRLGSTVRHGIATVGGEANALDLIYAFLLQEYGLDAYNYININQIGEDLNELILREGKNIHINLRYPVDEDFEKKSVAERNRIRLDVAHTGLLKIAEKEKKLDVEKLEAIRSRILENDFLFDFVYKTFVNKRKPQLLGKLIVHPEVDRFNFYILIEEDGKERCRLLLYCGAPTDSLLEELFFYGKWNGENELVIAGKEKEVEFHISIDQCKMELKNLTKFEKPPYFTMMEGDLSKEEKEKAYQDWLYTLPPAVRAVITHEPN